MPREIHDVRVQVSTPGNTLFGVLLLAFAVWYFRWWILGVILAITLVVGLILIARMVSDVITAQSVADAALRGEQARLRTRADEQNTWFHSGDPRGFYGHEWSHHEGLEP